MIIPKYDPLLPRDEKHPECQRQGHINSFLTGANVSGHEFVQVSGDNGLNAVLECIVCGFISRGELNDN